MKPNGQKSNVSVAINYLNEELLKLNVIHTQHVQEGVIVKYLEPWAEETEVSRLPAHEPICLARKPLSEDTIVKNVLEWGTGAININDTRVECTTVGDGNLALNPQLRNSINGGNGGNIFAHEDERRVVIPNQLGGADMYESRCLNHWHEV